MLNADCRGLTAMNEALFISHDPAPVEFRLRGSVLWTGMCIFAVQMASGISVSVLTLVCQSIGITHTHISALTPLS